jgi:hypothetical protein
MGSKSCSAQPVSPVQPSSGLLPTMAQPAPDPSGPPPVLPIATERRRCCRPLRCTAPCRTRPTDPNPACARPWLPWTSFPHACPGLTWMEFVGSLPTKENKNKILSDYLPILSTNPNSVGDYDQVVASRSPMPSPL